MHKPSVLTSVIMQGKSFQLGLSNPLPRVREGPCPGLPCRALWSSSPQWPGLCEVPLPTLWLSYILPQWYFQSTIMSSGISFPQLTVLPICGVIKLRTLQAGRRYTVGAHRAPARMMGAWDPCSAPGFRSPSIPPHRGVWELSRNAQSSSAVECKPGSRYTLRWKK